MRMLTSTAYGEIQAGAGQEKPSGRHAPAGSGVCDCSVDDFPGDLSGHVLCDQAGIGVDEKI